MEYVVRELSVLGHCLSSPLFAAQVAEYPFDSDVKQMSVIFRRNSDQSVHFLALFSYCA